ncbi:MAG: hypothetical protein JWN56_2305 [Sphingobacteriales bacterium]|nr:hypothetical protein [Sphingobacteriales bacterium]
MNNWFKRNGIHLAIIGIFVALCFIYFSPALQGKSLVQGDVQQAQGMQQEIMKYREIDGKGPLWTNAMFGGMPTYQIWVKYTNNVTTYVIDFLKIAFPNPIDTVLVYLLGAYLLFSVLRINPWLSAAGAIAFAFSSYNFIYIEAGHANQAMAIAYFAPILAGIILTFRKKYILGGSLTALFLAIEIRTNHVQMTYYLALALLIFVGIELYNAIKSKNIKDFTKPFGYLVAAGLLAILVNASLLWSTYELGQESIRGKSNLKAEKSSTEASSGLDKEYAYNWSQGLGETLTFIIPNAYGGSSSGTFDENSEVAKVIIKQGASADQATGFAKQMPSYWGEKPGTSGPWYFGAVVCFLFVYGLFIVRDRIKYWIIGATVLFLFLSFGKNFPLISDLFFNYFPLYSKFRAVESTLVIPALLIPILAILAIKEISTSTIDSKVLIKKLLYSLYITGGIVLIFLILPTLFFSFKPTTHDAFVQQLLQVTGGDKGFADTIANALVQDRIGLARADALRSLILILIGAGLTWALIKKKLDANVVYGLLAVVILFDLWTVDRRYLNKDNFVEKTQLSAQYQKRQVDDLILRDTDPDYRVLDLTSYPFTSSYASYFHKSVGGFHAARLKRFQELIDHQFKNSYNEDVLDMLNTKYVITSDEKGESQKIQNRSTAAGNAWFVSKVTFVKDADQEMEALNSFDPKQEIIVDEKYKSMIDVSKIGYGPTSFIKLTNYHPDHMTYEYSAGKDALAVFSEIYYDKGWNAYLDGEKIPYFRANYLLRAAQLPGGNHKLEFKFEPKSYYTGEMISLIASILLVLGLAYAIYREVKPLDPIKGKL